MACPFGMIEVLSERTRGGSIAPSNDPEVPAVKVDITATCKAWSWRSVAADLLGAPHDERERQGDQTEVRGRNAESRSVLSRCRMRLA